MRRIVVGWWMRVGRDVGDGIELAPGERRIERGEAVGDIVRRRKPERRIDIDAADQGDAVDGGEVLGVLSGHAASAQNKQCAS